MVSAAVPAVGCIYIYIYIHLYMYAVDATAERALGTPKVCHAMFGPRLTQKVHRASAQPRQLALLQPHWRVQGDSRCRGV